MQVGGEKEQTCVGLAQRHKSRPYKTNLYDLDLDLPIGSGSVVLALGFFSACKPGSCVWLRRVSVLVCESGWWEWSCDSFALEF